jgi:uncharacterized membrane protein
MWDRADVKLTAKSRLKKYYWPGLLVSFVLTLTSGGNNQSNWSSNSTELDFSTLMWLPLIILGAILFMIVGIAIRAFIGNILQVGGRKFYLMARKDKVDVGLLGFGFKKETYMNIVKTMLFKDIIVFLHFLLLIIPGIIKHYQYYFVSNIMADDPTLNHEEALEISKTMTNNQKSEIFIFDLSFIGWFILGGFFFGIGALFVMPYYDASKAELYETVKANHLT